MKIVHRLEGILVEQHVRVSLQLNYHWLTAADRSDLAKVLAASTAESATVNLKVVVATKLQLSSSLQRSKEAVSMALLSFSLCEQQWEHWSAACRQRVSSDCC